MKKTQMTQRWGDNTRRDDTSSGRETILSAAINCYKNNGIAGTTVDDIANEAKITRRTVYRYFPNKQAIVQAVVEEQAGTFFRGMRRSVNRSADDFASLLKNCMVYSIKNGPRTPGHQLLLGKNNASTSAQYYLSSAAIYEQWAGILRAPFDQAIVAGEIARDIDFDDLISFCGRFIHSYIQFPADMASIKKQIDSFLLRSLSPANNGR